MSRYSSHTNNRETNLNRFRSFPNKPITIITLLQVQDENLENDLRQVITLKTDQFRTGPYCRCETVKTDTLLSCVLQLLGFIFVFV
jgi:hypothetical protein